MSNKYGISEIMLASSRADKVGILAAIIRSELTDDQKDDAIHAARTIADNAIGEVDVDFTVLSARILSSIVLESIHWSRLERVAEGQRKRAAKIAARKATK